MINFCSSSEKKNLLESSGFNKLTPTVISNHIYFNLRKKYRIPLSKFISMEDVDYRLPIHLACLHNNLNIVKILLNYDSPLEIKDKSLKVFFELFLSYLIN